MTRTTEKTNTETPISNRLRKRRKPVMENSNADHSLAQKQAIPSSPKRKKVETYSLPKLSTTIQQKQQTGPVKISAENKELSSKKYAPKCNATKTKQKSSSPSSLSKCLEASNSKHPRKVNEMGVENEEEEKRNKLQKRKKPDIQISKLDHWLIQKGVISPLPNKKIKACSLPILSTNNKITQDEKFVKTIEESNTENRISKRIQKRKKCDMENSNADQLFAQKEIIPHSPKKKKIETHTSPRLSTIMQEIQCSEPVKTPDENLVQNNVMSNKKYSQKHTTKNKQKSLSKCLETSKSKHPKKHIKIGVEDNEEGKRNKFHNRKNPDVQISELDHQLTLKGVIPLLPHNEKIDDCSLSKLFRNMQEKPSEPEKTRVKNKVMSKKEYSPKLNNTKNKHKSVSATSSSKYLEASKTKQPRKVSRLVTKKTSNKMCPPKSEGKEKKQCTLKSFIIKNNTKTFKRNDSFESVDLPTFSNVTKKKPLKSSKVKEQKASFQKYGVILPTVEEILKDMEDLEYRRNKIKSFKPISEDSLELPFSNEILQKPAREKGLDCKHLTLDQLTSAFNLNASFLSDIINEKISNNRHQRYFNKNLKVLTMTSNDLTYNTTTIVFSYEQIDHLMSLLKKQFDPDDKKTKYFFQVLLPELCLQIFMKTYGMNLEQAVKYLGEMPLVD